MKKVLPWYMDVSFQSYISVYLETLFREKISKFWRVNVWSNPMIERRIGERSKRKQDRFQ